MSINNSILFSCQNDNWSRVNRTSSGSFVTAPVAPPSNVVREKLVMTRIFLFGQSGGYRRSRASLGHWVELVGRWINILRTSQTPNQ